MDILKGGNMIEELSNTAVNEGEKWYGRNASPEGFNRKHQIFPGTPVIVTRIEGMQSLLDVVSSSQPMIEFIFPIRPSAKDTMDLPTFLRLFQREFPMEKPLTPHRVNEIITNDSLPL